jgi:hypothetical protein
MLPGYHSKDKDFIQQTQGVKMKNKKTIHKKSQEAEKHLERIDELLQEIQILSLQHSYLWDTADTAMGKLSLLRYHISVISFMTEKLRK